MTESKCLTGGSDLQAKGFNQVSAPKKNSELVLDRMGVSTVQVKNIECKVGSAHTSNLCKMKTPGHTIALAAKWDRNVVSNCDIKK